MTIKRINEFPEGSGSLSNDDVFLFMDNPSSGGVTKKISLSQVAAAIGGGGGGNADTGDITFNGSTISTANPDQSMTITTNGSGDIYIGADRNMIFDMNGLSGKGILIQDSQEDGYDDPATPSTLRVGSIYHDTGAMVIKSDGNIVDASGNILQSYGGVWITNGDQTGFRVPPPTGVDGPYGHNVIIKNNGEEWGFASGTIILPSSGQLINTSNSSGDGNGKSTLSLVPDSSLISNDQYLIIDPTAPNHIHLRAGGNIDSSNAELIVGGENSNVRIGVGSNPEITIKTAGSNTVEFLGQIDNGFGDGPGATLHVTSIINGTITDGMTIYGEGLPAEGWVLQFGTVMAPQGDGGIGNYYLSGANYLIGSQLFNNSNSTNNIWTFANDGNLSIPGNILLDNGTSVAEGTFDNGTGGNNGVSLNCAVGYELNWQGGRLKSTYNNGESAAAIFVDSPMSAPPVVLESASNSNSINTNAKDGDMFDITLTENSTLANPTNPVNGKTLRWRITQDGTGNRTVTLGNKFNLPSSASSPLPWSTTANKMDVLAATYHAGRDKWDIVAFVPGY